MKEVKPFDQFIDETKIPILPLQKKVINTSGKCVGMSICFSGIRDAELEEGIVIEGGVIASGVSKKQLI